MRQPRVGFGGKTRGSLQRLVPVLAIVVAVELGLLALMSLQIARSERTLLSATDERLAAHEMEIHACEQELALSHWLQTVDETHLAHMANSRVNFEAALSRYRASVQTNDEELAWADRLAALGVEADSLSQDLIAIHRRKHSSLAALHDLHLRADALLDETIQRDLAWQKTSDELEINLNSLLLAVNSYLAAPNPVLRTEFEDAQADLAEHLADFEAQIETADELADQIEQAGDLGQELLALQDEQAAHVAAYAAALQAVGQEILDDQVQVEVRAEHNEAIAELQQVLARAWLAELGLGLGIVMLGIGGGVWLFRQDRATQRSAQRFQAIIEHAPFSLCR